MEFLKTIILDELIDKVVHDKISVAINVEPDRAEIQIEPWKPFEYHCPYNKDGADGET